MRAKGHESIGARNKKVTVEEENNRKRPLSISDTEYTEQDETM